MNLSFILYPYFSTPFSNPSVGHVAAYFWPHDSSSLPSDASLTLPGNKYLIAASLGLPSPVLLFLPKLPLQQPRSLRLWPSAAPSSSVVPAFGAAISTPSLSSPHTRHAPHATLRRRPTTACANPAASARRRVRPMSAGMPALTPARTPPPSRYVMICPWIQS